MYFLSLLANITKLVEKKFICKDVSNENVYGITYHAALLIGIHGYRNYSQACKLLNITKTYLYHILSVHKDVIGIPFHDPILGTSKWLSVAQIEVIDKIIHSKSSP